MRGPEESPPLRGWSSILFDRDAGIATITLNRPDRLNAFNDVMRDELLAALDLCDRDDDIGAVIVTGSGRAFCAGADLSSRGFEAAQEGAGLAQPLLPRDRGGVVSLRIFESLKPVIAAINGSAVGVGATMPLAMDLRIASTDARCAFAFGRRGIVPDGAASWFLPRAVGISKAMDWALTGRMVPADEMLASGLVSELHEPDQLLVAARRRAREIVDNVAPVSAALTRQLMWRMHASDHPMRAHVAESRSLYERMRSADAVEGVSAFFDKRPPRFAMRVSADMPEVFDADHPAFPEEQVGPRYAARTLSHESGASER